MVDILVVALAVVSAAVSARAIPPALASAQLVLHQQQLLDRGGVLVRYLPWQWHIPHLGGVGYAIINFLVEKRKVIQNKALICYC